MSSPAPSARVSGRGPDDVDLTDLEIIRRFSLAVRQDSAGRAEVLAALRSDLDRLERLDRSTSTPAARPSPRTAAKTPVKRAPAKRSARG